MRKALVLGKFYPPTLGHKHLIDFARSYVGLDGIGTTVKVFVATLPTETIDGFLRAQWLHNHYVGDPYVKVIHANEPVPQYPEQHEDFWNIWHRYIRYYCGDDFDLVFASEPYGAPLADLFGAEFVPVDIQRTAIPISATIVRDDVDQWFGFLLPETKEHFRFSTTVFGAESAGKTTLAKSLATRLDTVWVPEWARGYLNQVGVEVTKEKIDRIAEGQLASESALAEQANQYLIKDTDLHTTVMWSRKLLGYCNPVIERLANQHTSNLYLVADTDIPFEEDAQRYGGDKRQLTTTECTDYLDSIGAKYEVIQHTLNGKLANEDTITGIAAQIIKANTRQHLETRIGGGLPCGS